MGEQAVEYMRGAASRGVIAAADRSIPAVVTDTYDRVCSIKNRLKRTLDIIRGPQPEMARKDEANIAPGGLADRVKLIETELIRIDNLMDELEHFI